MFTTGKYSYRFLIIIYVDRWLLYAGHLQLDNSRSSDHNTEVVAFNSDHYV